MRRVNFPSDMSDEEFEAFYQKIGIADTRNTFEALQAVDRLLKPLGFELQLYSGSSDYQFEIVALDAK